MYESKAPGDPPFLPAGRPFGFLESSSRKPFPEVVFGKLTTRPMCLAWADPRARGSRETPGGWAGVGANEELKKALR